jgi:hypothetical protein
MAKRELPATPEARPKPRFTKADFPAHRDAHPTESGVANMTIDGYMQRHQEVEY